jgi:hypothetical protein
MTIPSETKKDCLLSGLSGQVVGNLFYVLGNGRHQRLFLDFFAPPKPAIAKSVELFGIRETSLYGLATQSVQIFT